MTSLASNRRSYRHALFCLLLGFSSAGCSEQEAASESLVRPVRVTRIASAGHNQAPTLAGIARASKEMALSFRVNGTLTKLSVKVGDEVKQRDPIAELDSKEASLQIDRARASVARTNAEFRSAKADYDRVKLLYADGSVSRSELDAARALQESKAALLDAEQKGLEMAMSTVRDHKLTAPLPGAIAEVPVEVNENVTAGQAVALLNAGEKAEVEVAVPERIIDLVSKGVSARVTFDSLAGATFDGVVTEVGVASSQGTAGFPVRVALMEADRRIRAGLSAVVQLELSGSESNKRIFAPAQGLLEDQKGQRYVLLAESKDDTFAVVKRRDVQLGEPTSLGVVVEDGLSGGELVITAGLSSITEGMRVKLLRANEPVLAAERLQTKKESPSSQWTKSDAESAASPSEVSAP